MLASVSVKFKPQQPWGKSHAGAKKWGLPPIRFPITALETNALDPEANLAGWKP